MRPESEPLRAAASLHAAMLTAILLAAAPAAAVELTGRVSVLGTVAWPRADDTGHDDPRLDTPTADQQSLRLMLEDHGNDSQWSVHLKTARQHLRGFAAPTRHSSDLFRYRKLSAAQSSNDGRRRSTRFETEIDRASWRHRFGNASISLGRQPVDWGSGRFWQPMNVFGAFAPTDLDTDFKPGIDAAVFDWYPSAFSSLTAVHALAPKRDRSTDDSTALRYRTQVGESSEMALLAGRVIGNRMIGASFESELNGIGWRVEGVHSRIEQSGEHALFWIAGLDYQFDNGTLVTLEWQDNGRGATSESQLAVMQSDRQAAFGLQQQLSRRVLGVSLQRDLTPLLRAHYTLLASALRDTDGHRSASLFHQLNFVYSVSDESDLLLSVSVGSGRGLDDENRPRSEFGHLPASATLRWRLYF